MGQNQIKLSGYSFSASNPVVGKILASEKLPNVKLSSKSETLFTLGKDNTIQVKKSALQTPADFLELVLVSENGKTDTFHIVKDEFVSNRVIAHRGAWKNTGATENSIAALQHAIKMGCTGSEFDIHMSSDSVLFVHHDHDMNGVHLEKTPAAELAKLKLANGESLPTLEAHLLEGLKQNKTKLILEIKPSSISKERGQALAQKVVEMVQKHKAQGWVDYISFDYDILKKVLELDPYARVAYLEGNKTPAELAKDGFFGLDYNQGHLQKNPHWIEEAHQLGLTVNVWTVNDPKVMDWLLERNVDFITTNEPELLLEKVKK
ncbi:glycerophosphodiester phosphodiesterase [Rufibacter roseus]|uniref:Glycerophosphodiester phosphodiesterase n=2 Tax=Rufibacter roseus TaxID=1567108 RepID=A0ABW2DQT1_9BACT